MPELPEVETIVQELARSSIIGSNIVKVDIRWSKTIVEKEFVKMIVGQQIVSVKRRAKYIILQLSAGFILIHLRMTGRLLLDDKESPHSPYERVCLTLSNELELRFIDTRKFGRIYLSQNLEQFFNKIGPEPLDSSFTWQKLHSMLAKRSTRLKPLLLNQEFIAGLGNIYVDEALWLAKLHPLRKANVLSEKEIKELFKAIQEALHKGIQSNGATLGNGKTNFYRLDGSKGRHIFELNVFRQTGKPCKRCNTLIEKIVITGRSTHFCPQCQKLTDDISRTIRS